MVSMRRIVFVVGALPTIGGCVGADEGDLATYAAPLHRQTGVPDGLARRVIGAAAEIPPDYPIGDVIRVVDLEGGGFVPGSVQRSGDADLVFEPYEGWRADRRYAWTVAPPTSVPHGPELAFSADLVGTAVFDTSDRLDVLGAAFDAAGLQVCVVLSRPFEPAIEDVVRITANDVEIHAVLYPLDADAWAPTFDLSDDDPGVDVACIDSEEPLEPGTSLRIWWNEEGPWRLDVGEDPSADLVDQMYRGLW
jgi:hypothetical protein